jgi:uncharacterized protein YcfL
MKKIIYNTLIVVVLLGVISCKSSKKNAKTNAETKVVEEVKPAQTVQEPTKAPVSGVLADPSQVVLAEDVVEETAADIKEKNSTYAYTVSFYSIGEGIDSDMVIKFKDFIAAYNSQKKVSLAYDVNPWGREGETDFCFLLDELDQKQRLDFISKCSKLLSTSKLVHEGENTRCHPKRR